jgi:hypothetical protein
MRPAISVENLSNSSDGKRMHFRPTWMFFMPDKAPLTPALPNPNTSGLPAQVPKPLGFRKNGAISGELWRSTGFWKLREAPISSLSPAKSRTYGIATFFGVKSNLFESQS